MHMKVKEMLKKGLKDMAAASVGKSAPINLHEPKMPKALKAANRK
jgi:cyclic lactone autoinducer peptide